MDEGNVLNQLQAILRDCLEPTVPNEQRWTSNGSFMSSPCHGGHAEDQQEQHPTNPQSLLRLAEKVQGTVELLNLRIQRQKELMEALEQNGRCSMDPTSAPYDTGPFLAAPSVAASSPSHTALPQWASPLYVDDICCVERPGLVPNEMDCGVDFAHWKQFMATGPITSQQKSDPAHWFYGPNSSQTTIDTIVTPRLSLRRRIQKKFSRGWFRCSKR